MVARLFDTAQPDLLNVAELARLHRSLGLRIHAGWREPMGEQTQRVVTLAIAGAPSPDHLVVELLRLAGVGYDVLFAQARRPGSSLSHALWHAQAHDQALQFGLGVGPTPAQVVGAIGLAPAPGEA